MHELALCQGVLAVALEAAGGQPVRRIRVRVGELQRVLPESWDMCWQMVAMDGPAAGAVTELAAVSALVHCRSCDRVGPPAPPLECAACGSPGVVVVGGEELLVEEVELADGTVLANPALVEEGV